MILIASKGHFFGQIPHPMQSLSDIKAILLSGVTSYILINIHVPICGTSHDPSRGIDIQYIVFQYGRPGKTGEKYQ